MNEVERYPFDVQGCLLLQDASTADEVAVLNRLIDSQNLPNPSLEGRAARFSSFLEWDPAFCDLVDHPRPTVMEQQLSQTTAAPNFDRASKTARRATLFPRSRVACLSMLSYQCINIGASVSSPPISTHKENVL